MLGKSKLEAFADDIVNIALVMRFVGEKFENIVRKEENAVYQHFLLSSQCFQKLSLRLLLELRIMYLKKCFKSSHRHTTEYMEVVTRKLGFFAL